MAPNVSHDVPPSSIPTAEDNGNGGEVLTSKVDENELTPKVKTSSPSKPARAQKKENLLVPVSIVGLSLVTLFVCDNVFGEWISSYQFESHTGLHNIAVPITAISLYLLMVFALPSIMKNREPMKLQSLMVVHNYFLSYLSCVMLFAVLREVFQLWRVSGIEGIMCDSGHQHIKTDVYFWYFVFYLSKMYEFIDTAILILRKKPLIFLHVYHHVITLLLCWYCLYDNLSIQWLSTAANTLVHVFMYYFYACQSLNVHIWWKKYLTSLQIIQFILDDSANLSWVYYKVYEEKTCSGSWSGFWFGVLVIGSFLILFIQFFKSTYSQKGKEKEL